ncbi:hypothetical protein CHELA40_14821 [Chelatococcus asaccharovorans]|nr:hypothetical protein CHELA17_60801 [Chelatococcus asaccharovorans]CAH1680173.1 hypothetical protein CHELA40_14821 [Chelatococcus asaccharovorans]
MSTKYNQESNKAGGPPPAFPFPSPSLSQVTDRPEPIRFRLRESLPSRAGISVDQSPLSTPPANFSPKTPAG